MVPIFHLETWDVDTFPFTWHLSSTEQHEQALCSSPEAKWCILTHVHMPKLSLPEKENQKQQMQQTQGGHIQIAYWEQVLVQIMSECYLGEF